MASAASGKPRRTPARRAARRSGAAGPVRSGKDSAGSDAGGIGVAIGPVWPIAPGRVCLACARRRSFASCMRRNRDCLLPDRRAPRPVPSRDRIARIADWLFTLLPDDGSLVASAARPGRVKQDRRRQAVEVPDAGSEHEVPDGYHGQALVRVPLVTASERGEPLAAVSAPGLRFGTRGDAVPPSIEAPRQPDRRRRALRRPACAPNRTRLGDLQGEEWCRFNR